MNIAYDHGARVCDNIWAQGRQKAVADVISVELFMKDRLKLQRVSLSFSDIFLWFKSSSA